MNSKVLYLYTRANCTTTNCSFIRHYAGTCLYFIVFRVF